MNILVVYGRHTDEKFAIRVGREVKRKINGITVYKIKGGYKSHKVYSERKMLQLLTKTAHEIDMARKRYGAEVVIDLHNGEIEIPEEDARKPPFKADLYLNDKSRIKQILQVPKTCRDCFVIKRYCSKHPLAVEYFSHEDYHENLWKLDADIALEFYERLTSVEDATDIVRGLVRFIKRANAPKRYT